MPRRKTQREKWSILLEKTTKQNLEMKWVFLDKGNNMNLAERQKT